MAFDDYRTRALVRAILVRRWVDQSKLEYSVTNGIIYFRGSIRPYLSSRLTDPDKLRDAEIDMAVRLERSLRAIPGVRDVVFQLDRLTKVGLRWKVR